MTEKTVRELCALFDRKKRLTAMAKHGRMKVVSRYGALEYDMEDFVGETTIGDFMAAELGAVRRKITELGGEAKDEEKAEHD